MPLLDESAKGVYIISVTPFSQNGDLDLVSTDRLIDFYLENGATGLTVLGMMGEAPKLTAAESYQFVKRVLARVRARVPVVVGVSAPGYSSMRELSERVIDAGAAGVMVAPAGNLRMDEQIYGYFEQVAEHLGDIPFALQDFPLGTGVRISVDVIRRLIDALPTCVMLKHEDWPGLGKISMLRVASDQGQRRISILTGNGGMFLPEELRRGADGAMTGFAYPEMMVGIWKAHLAGDTERAQDLFDAYLPLARYEQQPDVGLAVRKYTLARRGAIACAALRRPGATLSSLDTVEIERLVARQTRRLAEIA